MAATSEVVIDRTEEEDRYRFTCPRGHTTWDRTNNHIWCPSCRREAEHDDEDIDPEWYVVYDQSTDLEIPWEQITLAEDQV